MNGIRQTWLVAAREMRERSRTRAFRASVVIMVLVVVAVIALPAMLDRGPGTKHVGLAGAVAAELPATIRAQSTAIKLTTRVHRYDRVAAGEQAVRDGHIDVLVVDGRRLEWQRATDEQLRAVVTSAIQLVAVRQRAAAAGITPSEALALIAPVPVTNVHIGHVAGRSTDDETAAFVMTVLLFMAIATYGVMVLSGVVEEKATRVVEVLLARMPARRLLAGKIIGIGLLGFLQFAAAALAALASITAFGTVDLPSIRAATIVWIVIWFVLGYALYATVYGTLGSLASRTEDAQSAAGPVGVVLMAAYFISFATIASPGTAWAKVVSYFPVTAPLAMPNRIAMGAAAWWEPFLAAVLTAATIVVLVRLGARVYAGAILHSGPTLKLSQAWHATTASHAPATDEHAASTPAARSVRRRLTEAAPAGLAVAVGGIGALITGDVIIGVAIGAAGYAIVRRLAHDRAPRRAERRGPPPTPATSRLTTHSADRGAAAPRDGSRSVRRFSARRAR